MSSTPTISCSSGVAIVADNTCAVAPGYEAVTTTVGGTTSGYSAIGKRNTASRPSTNTTNDSTPAKIGRSMKKWVSFMGAFDGCAWTSSLRGAWRRSNPVTQLDRAARLDGFATFAMTMMSMTQRDRKSGV